MSPSTYPNGVTRVDSDYSHPKYGKYHVSSNSDDDDDDPIDGQYRCLTCESVTEIENEHAKNATNWCTECDELRTFSRVDTDE
jgi:hypothetical protein